MSHRSNAQLVASLPPISRLPERPPASISLKRKESAFPMHCHITGTVQHMHDCRVCCMRAVTAVPLVP